MSKSFAELLEESLKSPDMWPGAIITGIVVDIDGSWVTVHASLKPEGVIPVEQFYSKQDKLTIKVSDEVHVTLDTVEDDLGETKLSREKTKRVESWIVLKVASAADEVIKGVTNSKVKGGFTVDVNSIHVSLPGPLVDVRLARNTTRLGDKGLEFKVIKLDQKRNSVVISRRSALEAENSAERGALLESLQEDQRVKGIVKNLTDYGTSIDLGGVNGLLHITDVVWKHTKYPSEIVDVGDEIGIKVLRFNRKHSRVSLGLKQLGEDSWVTIRVRYLEGTRVMARATNLIDYGCFAELEEGVEGLIYVSEMDWTNKDIHPSKVIWVGDEVEVQVLNIDEGRRYISSGIKQCKPNPWEDSPSQFSKGNYISGIIESIADFDIFIGLDGGIDDLVHLSDISWNEVGEEAVCRFKKGDELETIILSVDPEHGRISLGIKQLENGPFFNYAPLHEKSSIVRDTVKEVDVKGAVISLGDDIKGILKTSEIGRDRVEDARSVLKEGGEVGAKIISIDYKSCVISLSVKSKDVDDRGDAMKELCKQEIEGAGPTTIGDLIRAQIENQS